MTDIKIVGTMTDAFISEISYNGETFSAYYEEHNNALILHRYHDFVTRFVVFYENDEKLHSKCIRTLLRPGMEILKLSDMSLEPLFRKAMKEYRLKDRI